MCETVVEEHAPKKLISLDFHKMTILNASPSGDDNKQIILFEEHSTDFGKLAKNCATWPSAIEIYSKLDDMFW